MEKILLTIDARLLKDPAIDALFKKLGIPQKINVETAQASSSFKSLSSSFTTAFAKFGLVTNGISAAITLASKLAGTFIKPASEIEQLKLRLVSLYGSTQAAEQAFAKFQDVATRTPATLQQITEAGASLKAFGLNAETTLESVSDLAAYMGLDVVEAAQAVGRAFAGGAGAADILRERGVLELIKSFKGIDDLTNLTLPQFRDVLLQTLSDPAAGIAGSADRISKSYAGAMSNLNDSFTQLKANIGSSLTPILGELANGLGNVIKGLTGTGSNLQIASRNASDQKIQFESLIITYTDLHNKQNRSATDNEIYKKTVNDLLKLYPNYFSHIDLEKGKWENISTAIDTARISLNNYLNERIVAASTKDLQEIFTKTGLAVIKTTEALSTLKAEMKVKGKKESSAYAAYSSDVVTYGEEIRRRQTEISKLEAKEKSLQTQILNRINLSKKLFPSTTPPITPPQKTPTPASGSGSNGGGNRPSPSNVVDEAKAAHDELTRFLASERELVQIEYERLLNLAKVAYATKAEDLESKTKALDDWRTARLDEITKKEQDLADEKQRRLEDDLAAEKQLLLTNYNAEIDRLADLKTIGALTYDELTSKLRLYAEQIKATFGAESDEYKNALAAMRSAQLRISETLADQWRQDNAAFLDAWNTTTNSLVAGFDTAWASILDSSLSGSQRLNQIWTSIRNSFLASIGSMASQYIKAKLTQLSIELTVEKSKQAAILQTLGIQKSSLITSVAAGIKSAFAGLFEAISNVWKWWTKLIPPPYSVVAAIATGGAMVAAFNSIKRNLGFASGGFISGPGSATSDSIPIMASNGEYVVNARSVSTPGVLPLLNYLNNLNSPALATAPISSHYATGGLVSNSPFPGFNDLISEVRLLRADLYKAQPTIINHAPNPIEIHKAAETGRKLYKGY